MECLLQYLDDIDDLVGAIGLVYESLRRVTLALAILATSLVLVASGVVLALVSPPMALAACIVLLLALLYRTMTVSSRGTPAVDLT